MARFDTDFIRSVKELETVVSVCCGPPDDELPQVETYDNVVAHIVSDATGKCMSLVDAELDHQTDSS